jgi:hypothetical protein
MMGMAALRISLPPDYGRPVPVSSVLPGNKVMRCTKGWGADSTHDRNAKSAYEFQANRIPAVL